MTSHSTFTKSLGAASANNIATSQAAVAGTPLTLNGASVAAGVATIDAYNAASNSQPGRRVLITSTSAVETASITITGTNSSGNIISETDTFSGSSTTLQSNNDFVTVTQIVPSGTIVGSLSAGTNGLGASVWQYWNYRGDSPMNLAYAVELVSGSVNYTVQYTYDDPNRLPAGVSTPLAFNTILLNQAATADSTLSTPVLCTRVLINSGTGVIRIRTMQAGIG
jgi:hypothetical protein